MRSVEQLLQAATTADVKYFATSTEAGYILDIDCPPEAKALALEMRRRDAEILRHMGHEPPPPPPKSKTVMRCFSDIAPEQIVWLWEGRIATGKLTLIPGDPGVGKSFLTCDIASKVSTGGKWPDGAYAPKGSVIFLNAEDDAADTIRPRLDACGADVSKVFVIDAIRRTTDSGEVETGVDLGADLEAIEAAIVQLGDCRLIICDPITAYCGSVDSHKNADVRGLLKPLSDMAAKHGVAIVAITHLRKGEGSAIYRSMGSLAFVAAARSAWAVMRDPEDETKRLFLNVKNNVGTNGGGLAYRLIGSPGSIPTVVWETTPETRTADDVMEQARSKPGPEPEAFDDATEWLQSALRGGPRLAKELLDEWKNGQGGSERTLKRAKQSLGVEAFRNEVPGPWWCRLPSKGAKGANVDTTTDNLGPLGPVAENKGFSDATDTRSPRGPNCLEMETFDWNAELARFPSPENQQ